MQDAGNTALFPGIYAKAMIEITDQFVPALPNESIVQSDGLKYIFIQASSSETRVFTVKKIPVKKALRGKLHRDKITR